MNVSVVLPILIKTDKHLSMTMKCLCMAKKFTNIPFELIIVETGSQYFSEEADIYIYEKNVTTPEISHNNGFRMACRSDFVVLLTNDVFVREKWLECLLEPFQRHPDCGASTLASTQFGHIQENKIEEGNWWSIAAIKQEVFKKCGYYDERFINCWCDTDLLLRMRKEGYKMYRNFNCVVDHLVGATNYDKPDFKKNYEEGRKLYQEKHEGCGLELYEVTK
jgi:GT2 family glycosyltransferase